MLAIAASGLGAEDRASLDPQIWWLLLAIGAGRAGDRRAHPAAPCAAGLAGVRRRAVGLYGLWGYPMLNGDRSALDVMEQARRIAGPEATIGLLAWKEQNLLMAQGPVTEFGFLKPWPQQLPKPSPGSRAPPIAGSSAWTRPWALRGPQPRHLRRPCQSPRMVDVRGRRGQARLRTGQKRKSGGRRRALIVSRSCNRSW